MMGNKIMTSEMRLSIIVFLITFVLSVNCSCSDASEHGILNSIKQVVTAFHVDKLEDTELKKIEMSFLKKRCDSEPLIENYESDFLYLQFIYSKKNDKKVKQDIESVVIQIKEKDNFVLIGDLVEIFGEWDFRTKRAKRSFVSFSFNPDDREFKTKIKCTDIFWKDLVKTLILTKVANDK